MKILLFVISCLSTFVIPQACLNYYYGVDKHGHTHVFEEGKTPAPAFNKNFNAKSMESKLTKLLPKIKETGDYKLLSDYAVILLKAGKHQLSLDIMQVLYHNHPDQYQLAANLGTAFEINGNLDSALFYINRGMELNPDAHDGSEWVHIKVLETKQNLITDSLYLKSNSVLGISEEAKESITIRNQILIQAAERFPFTPGPDPIMASILVDLADAYKNTESIEYASALYKLANSYYGARLGIIAPREKEIDSLGKVYASIKLKRGEVEGFDEHGDFIKESKLKQYKVLDDNNETNYQIDFSNLEMDFISLLTLVNLSPLPIPEIKEVEIDETPIIIENSKNTIPTSAKKEKKGSLIIFYILGAITLIILIIVLKKNRSKA